MTRPQMVLLLVGVLALGGGILFLTMRRTGTAAAPAVAYVPPPPTIAGVQHIAVHVIGAVRSPGMYWLPAGSRVADAIAAGGGMSANADFASVNLAALLQDGQQIEVKALAPVNADLKPAPGGAPPPAPASGVAAPAPATATRLPQPSTSAGQSPTPSYPVSLSQATLEQLQTLPGIGPELAKRILYYRYEHGAFRSIDDLVAVPGIGPGRLAEIRPYLRP